MARPAGAPPESEAAVREYKAVLSRVLENRPSGTRQRIAAALGKNRSFVTQIVNPAYPTPLPAKHLELIFEICHFSAEERRQFLDAYGRAHPRRLAVVEDGRRMRAHTVYVPDLGDAARNARFDAMVDDFVRKLAAMVAEERD
jgi:hypothetical protein